MSPTIGEAVRHASHSLEQHGVSEPRAAAEILLADLLALSRTALVLDVDANQVAGNRVVQRPQTGGGLPAESIENQPSLVVVEEIVPCGVIDISHDDAAAGRW